jgi:hypothetical protein
MSTLDSRTTISVNLTTKTKLDQWRAYGQCYDGFLIQLVELWERMHPKHSNQRNTSSDNFTDES